MARAKFEVLFLVAVIIYSTLIVIELQYRQVDFHLKENSRSHNDINIGHDVAKQDGQDQLLQSTTATVIISTTAKDDNHTEYVLARRTKSSTVRPVKHTLCPEKSSKLLGRVKVDLDILKIENISDVQFLNRSEDFAINFGGWWQPKHCKSRVKVAILIPYRNRPAQLSLFLRHMHPIFQRQLLAYRVFLIEQVSRPILYICLPSPFGIASGCCNG